ncbi:MAG: D-alanyl-D-alanine carboxypeptidase [Clostridia bacterium]|nr:D-alanyl-D-alanine carboxypeptidase [Clostridia bacterium]
MSDKGQILYAKNAGERSLIASTTKLMTALLTIESGHLYRAVEIMPEHCAVEGSSMYLKPGERYSVLELLEGLMLASGNDAALALADAVGGDRSHFVKQMNERAEQLGMRSSHFANPHGLDEEGHYSTAEDMARLMARCMQNETFAQLVGLKSCTVRGLTLINHNKLLNLCPGCLGGKTGYTEAAGRCLVSCCERAGLRLICVTLDDPQDWLDHQSLYDWAFSAYSTRNVTSAVSYELPVISGQKAAVEIKAEPLELLLPTDKDVALRAELPRFVFAPVQAGDTAGKIKAVSNDEILGETRLVYGESCEQLRRARIF